MNNQNLKPKNIIIIEYYVPIHVCSLIIQMQIKWGKIIIFFRSEKKHGKKELDRVSGSDSEIFEGREKD